MGYFKKLIVSFESKSYVSFMCWTRNTIWNYKVVTELDLHIMIMTKLAEY